MDEGTGMIVADANLILALAIKGPQNETAVAVLKKDSDWAAPALWESEFRNGMLGMIRAQIIGHREALMAHQEIAHLVQTFTPSSATVLRIAESHNLTAYDAEYAAIAEWLEIPLLSFDSHLLKPALAIHPKDF